MRVLVACEFSGIVRDAFRARGHDAWSCDLLPSEGKPLGHWFPDLYPSGHQLHDFQHHYKCDVLDILPGGRLHQTMMLEGQAPIWDLMIAFPPCTYLSYAGAARWHDPSRKEKREQALQFFLTLYHAPIEKVAIENPHGWPRVAFRKPDQEIHPYYFGDKQMKRTLLWLKNLPLLEYSMSDSLFWKQTSTEKPEPNFIRKDGNKQYFCSTTRNAHKRSKFWPGIARAMAEQWG